MGGEVRNVTPGTPCVIVFVSNCGECSYCKIGRPNLCLTHRAAKEAGELPAGGRRLRLDGRELYHYSAVSCFAEYAVVPGSAVIPIGEDVPLEDAALFGCGVITGAGAVINTAHVPPGATMAVVGLATDRMVRIGTGRDAADASFATIFGDGRPSELTEMAVFAEPARDETPATTARRRA